MFIRFCCTLLMMLVLCCSLSWKFTVLLAVLSVGHCCACCAGPLLVLGAVLVLTDRLDLLPSSLGLPVASGMASPGMTTLGSLLAPSSGSGRKATCEMPLHSSLSPFFILHISTTEPAGDAQGFIFAMGYIAFLLALLNLLSLVRWP